MASRRIESGSPSRSAIAIKRMAAIAGAPSSEISSVGSLACPSVNAIRQAFAEHSATRSPTRSAAVTARSSAAIGGRGALNSSFSASARSDLAWTRRSPR